MLDYINNVTRKVAKWTEQTTEHFEETFSSTASATSFYLGAAIEVLINLIWKCWRNDNDSIPTYFINCL